MIFEAIKLGIDQYDKIVNNADLVKAFKQRLYREIKFNIEILFKIIEVSRKKEKTKLGNLINLLQTDFYDYLNDSLLSIDKILPNKVLKIDKCLTNFTINNKNFINWSKDLRTLHDVLERTYHRLKILKALASADIGKNIQSYKYLHLLNLILRDSINE